jgi:hypothetical protein
MKQQLKLDLFKGEKVEKEFDRTCTKKSGRGINVIRNENGTFMTIDSLNFLEKYSGVEFRFSDTPFDSKFSCGIKDIVIPELANMSLSRIQEFAKQVIENLDLGKYAWNYEHRAKDFHSIVNADENMANNYVNKQLTTAMVGFYKAKRELEGV